MIKLCKYCKNHLGCDGENKFRMNADTRELVIAELEKIKTEILEKVWRDAQGQIVTRDGFNHGIITTTDIIDKHISELKGENND